MTRIAEHGSGRSSASAVLALQRIPVGGVAESLGIVNSSYSVAACTDNSAVSITACGGGNSGLSIAGCAPEPE